MFFADIEDVIPEPNIVCVSPHYDDFLFFLGGYVLELKRKGLLAAKRFANINTFSRSNFLECDTEDNKDRSLTRVKYVAGIRLIEDLECLDGLLGPHNYHYRVMGEEESLVRGKAFSDGEDGMKMAFGDHGTMEVCDLAVLERMEACIKEIAVREGTAIVLPLSMKGHIDHFIVREAGIRAMRGGPVAAAFYFAEDKPYAGIMTESESETNEAFISLYALEGRAFRHHPEEVLELAHKHYQSQMSKIYDEGVRKRNEQLKLVYGINTDCDRIYKAPILPQG